MGKAETLGPMSPGLARVAERARRDPQRALLSLAHHIDRDALHRAYRGLRKDAAVGVDGVTKEEYGRNLAENLRDLHERLKTYRYRHQPILREHIPKEGGGTRPIGISTVEDKIVQDALRELLEAIYEQDFMECSYGFRPGRRPHDALRALDHAVHRGGVEWILEADVESFFDSVDRSQLKEMLKKRVGDKSLLRLIGKCLHVGVLDGEAFSEPEEGTVQGSVLSPILGNIYLHYALDDWFEHEVKPRLEGRAVLIRYADDFIMGFERADDAKRVMGVLEKRTKRFGLNLKAEKTRLIDFRRPSRKQDGGKGPSTFDFLGFTAYWRRSRNGGWYMALKTRRARLRRAVRSVYEWCRSHRHWSIPEQHSALKRRIQGHFNYFGVNGNVRSLVLLNKRVESAWFKWLRRRSQRSRLTWERYHDLLQDYPLPKPRVIVDLWGL
jgi:RNA-directed DNA polymerase